LPLAIATSCTSHARRSARPVMIRSGLQQATSGTTRVHTQRQMRKLELRCVSDVVAGS
jgi:hypothetical protein